MISSSSYPQRFHLLLTPIIITIVSGGGNYRTSLIKQCRTLCKKRVRMATRNPLANSQERLLQAKGMVLTNFDGTGVGFGFGIGCGFGVGWGFGGMPMHIWGLGVGGGCGVGLGLGWGFGTGFGSQYRVAKVAFEGINFDNKDPDDKRNPTHSSKNTQDIRASQ